MSVLPFVGIPLHWPPALLALTALVIGRYRWKVRVRVRDEDDRASEWSDPARFEVKLDRTSG
jgi:hypothetical protein